MSSKHYALISMALYVVLLALAFHLVRITPTPPPAPQSDIIYIEMEKPEPEKPKEKPKPKPKPVKKIKEAPRHEKLAKKDNSQQVSGKAEETRTVNQRALFNMSKDGVDKPTNAGNPYARQDTVTTAAGTGGGLNPIGNDALDEGLQGRGLKGDLPLPVCPAGNQRGVYKVVVNVQVNSEGVVTSASFNQSGSTTNHTPYVNAAIAAARKARFAESKAFTQGGEITYIFRVE